MKQKQRKKGDTLLSEYNTIGTICILAVKAAKYYLIQNLILKIHSLFKWCVENNINYLEISFHILVFCIKNIPYYLY